MRKISFSPPLKRGLFSMLAFVGLVLVGLGIAKAADLQLPTAEGTQINLNWDNNNKYYFTAPSDGVLSISLNKMLTYKNYLLFEEDGTGVPFATKTVDEWTPVDHILSATWNLTAGKTYYFTNTAGDDGVVCIFSWSGEGGDTGGGTTDPDPGSGGGDVTVGGTLALNTLYPVTYDQPLTGTISFNEDGKLTAKYTSGGDPVYYGPSDYNGILFTNAACDENDMVPVFDTNYSDTQVFSVKAGSTYYVNAYIGYPMYGEFEITFTFEVDGPMVDVDVPEGYEAMPIVRGPLSDPQQSNATQITADGNFYFFQAPSEGKLVVWQWGGSRFDGHLWKIPFANDNWEPWGNQVPDTGSPLDSPTPNYITYPLSAGQQVYWYAKSGQGITYAIFAWEGTDVATIPSIGLNDPTTVAAGQVYTFTATESGVLLADLSTPASSSENVSFSTGLAALPAEQHFFYANSGHSQEVQALATTGGAEGWRVAFEVEQGVTYYVFNPTLSSVVFTFSMDPNGAVTPKLEAVQPLPGGIDNDAQESTITVQFYPAAVSIASVDFVYTNLQGQLQTIKNVQCDFLSGAYNIPRAQHMNMDGTKLHEAYDDPNATVYYQISKAEGAVQRYILHQVNYNGKPLAETAITAGVDIAADGTLTLNYAVDTPPTLVSQVVPDPFYHEWAAGDPAGIMVLTYNKDLNPAYTPEVNIIEGTQYYGSEPGENDQTWAVNPTHIKVEGKTVTVDFTGSDAFLTAEESVDGVPTSIPWGPGRSNITIYVGGVMGMNNLPASYSGDPAFMPHVTYVSQDAPEPEPVAADIVKVTPAYGSVIYVEDDGSSSFEITFNQEVTINWVGTYNRMNRQHATTYETSPAFGASAKVWKVIIPAKDIEEAMRDNDENASIFAYVEAYDKDGEVVQGSNTLDGENRVDNYGDSFALWFNVEHAENPGMPFTTSLVEGTNEAPLRSFTVSSEWGSMMGKDENVSDGDVTFNPFKGIKVTGPDGFEANAESFDGATQSVILDQPIVAAGEYEVYFPFMAFDITAPEEGGISKSYYSEECTVKFNVVLGDEIYDSQVDDIQMTAYPVHGETADEATEVTHEEMTEVTLQWNGRDLELTGEGGLTVSGPNGYFADFGTDAHNFSIVDGYKVVIDMATVYAEIADEIKNNGEGVIDNTYYNGVYKFTLAKKTVKIEGQGQGARALDPNDVVYNDEVHLYYNISFAAEAKEPLVFNNQNFYPKANVKYYFAPETAGTLKWQIFQNGDVTSTIVVGGIYEVYSDSDSELVTPTESDEMPDIFGSTFSYASYDLEEGSEYYFMWNKNGSGDDYALLVTWDGGEIDTPTGPANTLPIAQQFYPTANEKYYYTPTVDGTLKVELVNGSEIWLGSGFLYLESDDSPVNPSGGDLTTPWDGASSGSEGVYTLKAGVTYYVMWPKDNSGLEYPMIATWTVDQSTGIFNIEAVDGVYRVYNINGVNVLNTEDPLELKNLEHGLYIVNGKKIIL